MPGCSVRAQESSIVLGLRMLPRVSELLERESEILSVLISEGAVNAVPKVMPQHELAEPSALEEWIWAEHAATGRLLLFPTDGSWWIVEDADWEVLIVCGSDELLHTACDPDWDDDSALFEWLPMERLEPRALAEAQLIATRYALPLADQRA
jgi:hypothetical protein